MMVAMDTRTGEIGPLADDETLPTVKEFQEIVRGQRGNHPLPERVEVGPEYADLSPRQRLALLYERGTDRTGSRTHKKSERARRYERAARREARKRP